MGNKLHSAIIRTLARALSGEGAHVKTATVFMGIDWKTAGIRPEGVPHSLFQLLGHMLYWQDWVLKWLDGENPPVTRHASSSWPSGTEAASAMEWRRAVQDFRRGLAELDRRSREADLFVKHGKKSPLEMLQAIASHNSYHAGQAALLRRMLGKWPPPSGGLTW